MIRQWQETFYEKTTNRLQSSHRISSSWPRPSASVPAAVRTRADVMSTVDAARKHKGPFLINFPGSEQEDTVYPMIVPRSGLARDDPAAIGKPIGETASDV